MQCASEYDENHAFLTFIDSVTHFSWSTTSGTETLGLRGALPRGLIEIRVSSNLLGWQLPSSPFTFLPVPSQGHFPPPESNICWTKDRGDVRLQVSKNYWSGSSKLPLSSQIWWKSPAWNHYIYNNQGYIDPNSPIVRSLATAHCLTSIGIGDKHFLARLMLLFNN